MSIALTLRQFFSFEVPLFGENGMRVGISGIFSTMPSILFGPMWGAIATGVSDVLGFMLRPTGAYLPLMTLVMASGGFLRGLVWVLLRNRNAKKIRAIVFISAAAFILFAAANWTMFRLDGITTGFFDGFDGGYVDTSGMNFMSRFIIVRALGVSTHSGTLATMLTTFTYAPFGVGVLGLALCAVDLLLSAWLKKEYKEYASIMPLLIAMLVGAWWQSTFNTVILRQQVWQSWQLMPFVVVWLPRILQTTLTTTVYSYFVAFLLEICKRQKHLRPYLR